jgi:hypothetical protein
MLKRFINRPGRYDAKYMMEAYGKWYNPIDKATAYSKSWIRSQFAEKNVQVVSSTGAAGNRFNGMMAGQQRRGGIATHGFGENGSGTRLGEIRYASFSDQNSVDLTFSTTNAYRRSSGAANANTGWAIHGNIAFLNLNLGGLSQWGFAERSATSVTLTSTTTHTVTAFHCSYANSCFAFYTSGQETSGVTTTVTDEIGRFSMKSLTEQAINFATHNLTTYAYRACGVNENTGLSAGGLKPEASTTTDRIDKWNLKEGVGQTTSTWGTLVESGTHAQTGCNKDLMLLTNGGIGDYTPARQIRIEISFKEATNGITFYDATTLNHNAQGAYGGG